MGPKVNPQLSREEMELEVKSSSTWLELTRKVKGNSAGSSVETVKRWVKHYNLDISHFTFRAPKTGPQYKYSPLEMFVENSPASNTVLAKFYRRLFPAEKCSECGIGTVWNNKPLTLHIDHRNGHGTDWRLENCRYLCPNCHYQTDTHGTKRGVTRASGGELKANPSELSDSFDQLGCYKQVGLIYGVSDRSAKNIIRKYRKCIVN
jgi:hypothetical protein